jgi:putative ABC transport system permease protein
MFMFKNYFVTAFRNLTRERTSTFLNIAGLTLGITCSLILFLIIDFHNSFDTVHSRRDRIYRVVHIGKGNQEVEYHSGVPAIMRDQFVLDFPEVEEVAFTSYRADALILVPQRDGSSKKYRESRGVVFTEPTFFKIFDRDILHGSGQQALDEPNEAVISRQLAIKYFGREDVTGEVIRFENQDYKVSGVMTDAPSNTDLPFDLMLSYITIKKEREQQGWYSIWSDEHCYFLLKEGENIMGVEARLPLFSKTHRDEDADRGGFHIQSLAEMHTDERFETHSYQTVPKSILVVLGAIAAILVLTACINFINLSTAEAIKRSKEVGIRKTMGSSRWQLVTQFLGETGMVTLFSIILSLGITQIALGFINPMLQLQLSLQLLENTSLALFIVGIAVAVTLFSGLYPAIVISSFNPAMALKNRLTNRSSSGYYMRSALVVFQFFISQFFIIGTIVLIRQTDYFMEKDLGFEKEAIVIVPLPSVSEDRQERAMKRRTFREEVSNIPGVELASLGSAPPSSGMVNKTPFRIEGDNETYVTQYKEVDGRYIDMYKLNMIAGKALADLDSITGLVVNEKFAATAGYQNAHDIVGKLVSIRGRDFPVTGVLKNFHTVSLQNGIEPTVLFNHSNGFRSVSLKVNLSHVDAVLEQVKNRWEQHHPDELFEYYFLDERIKSFYEGQKKIAGLLSVFTIMAIFIGCLGLFGLASFVANQKTKEIGVRKVLGASVQSLLADFSWNFLKLIAIGFLIALPVGWLAMKEFLNAFAYRITLGPDVFILAFVITNFIALVTVGYKSLKAALANPVQSLRYE